MPASEDHHDWRDWARVAEPYARPFAITMAIIAVPLALLYLTPLVLGLFAPRLDPRIDLYAVNRPLAFTFLDAAGEDVGHRGAIVGKRLSLKEMPSYLPAAFIAMEDRRFYSHKGIDPLGLGRALLLDLRARHYVAGGSTISQQTAKIVYTQQQKTMSRKLVELIDAAGLEKSLSKQQILELYLNRIYLGSGAYGVDGAAQVYFGTSARNLSLAQAAMLATLTRAPSVFSPRRDLLRAQQRASLVLDSMMDNGAITEADAAFARAHPAVIVDHASLDARNYFLDSAADEATRFVSQNGAPPSADLVVHTTLEPKVQEAAREAASRTIAKSGKKTRTSEAAVVVMKPDGAVSALIGGVDYQDSVFNRATQAHRQPGSAFKPFVYLAALESGLSPWETRDDVAVDIGGYHPTNFGGKYYGTLTLADALAHSVNTITVNLAPGDRRQECGGRRPAAGHHLAARGQCLAGAGHQRGHAAGIDRRLCRLRQWRLSRLALHGHASGYERQRGLSAPRADAAAGDLAGCEPRSDRHALWRGGERHRRLCLAAWPRGRGQDRHDTGLA